MNTTDDHSPSLGNDSDDNPRLVAALREYQTAVDAGRRPSRKEMLARYPDVADELSECLEGLELLRSAAPGIHGGRARPAAEPLPPEAQLGDFRLLQVIGRGGMGVVYEAVQLSLGRRVALKVLPLAATFDGRQLQRFENEARAAAHLHHGNIVPVFAVGCERGVPYYAMQLIDGQTLAAVIDGLRQAPAPVAPATPAADTVAGAGSLTHRAVDSPAFFRTVATVGVQAAEALEYAHQMGVVHRDVKPGNLLLDVRGKLWVADFGLARFQEAEGVTAPGDIVGTLRYMSPEQAAGLPVIDPRSDVYGLGVTLYELLTREPAVPGRDRRECLRQILEEEPVAPRRLNRAVPPELETIVLKAMAKSPEDRYASAKELADDLGRFLADQPVRAKAPGLWDHVSKWARRHSRAVAAAALALAAAVVVLSGTTWWVAAADARTQAAYRKLQEEQGKTEEALTKEAAQRDRAEKNLAKAREVLDFLNRLGVEEMAESPAMQGLRRRLLAKLVDYYQDFIEQYRDDPTVADELAEARLQVSELLVEVGRKADALAAFQKMMRDGPPRGGPGKEGPRFGGPGNLPRGIARLFLLGQPAVQKELQLSPAQADRIKALLDFGARPPSNEEARAAEAGIAQALRPEQSDRLEQISRQTRGVHALLDPETAQALNLKPDQTRRLRDALNRGRHPHWKPAPGGPRLGGPKQADEALKVLSEEQRACWATLKGKPFSGDLRVPPHPSRPKARGSMAYSYYEGRWQRLPDFDTLTPDASGVGPAFDLGLARRRDNYALRFEGSFRLDQDAECTFILSSDDGSKLYVDGKLVVDNDGQHPAQTRQGKAWLRKGTHRVIVAYFQTYLDADLVVEMQAPGLGRCNLGDLVAPTESELDGARR